MNQPTKANQTTATVLTIIIIGLIIYGFVSCFSSGDTTEKSYEDKIHDLKIEAWVMAEQFIDKQLKAPATAKYQWFTEDNVTKIGDQYTVEIYVDSENSFGAKLRTHWKLKMEKDGDTYRLLDIQQTE